VAKVFHVLTESEPFSEYHGGAISRWTANVVRFEEDAIVLAPSADGSWPIDSSRVRVVDGLSAYRRFNEGGGYRLPWVVLISILGRILGRALHDLHAGDTVWIHNRPDFALALEPLIRRRGARLFLHLHNSHLVEWSERVTRAFTADCYVFVSRFLQDEALINCSHLKRTEVLYNGADRRIFYPKSTPRSPEDVPVVLFASRLVPEKGLHVFLEAMELLQKEKVRVRGVVVGGAGFGDSAPTAYVKEMQRRAPSNIKFEPYCSGSALGDRFRSADIFCLPSCWQEPLGMVALEAMACALPVVAANSGGLPETLSYGGGILVARESASELAAMLGLLATDADLRKRLAQEAYASFQMNFTWDAVRSNYRKILASAADESANLEFAVERIIYA
jgi:spore coat protein SA